MKQFSAKVQTLLLSLFTLFAPLPLFAHGNEVVRSDFSATPLFLILGALSLCLLPFIFRARGISLTRKKYLALCLVLALSGGGLFHALTPHSHAHHENVWASLHASLHTEEKKTLLPSADFLFLSLFLAPLFFRRRLTFVVSESPLLTALRRGILPHRAFR